MLREIKLWALIVAGASFLAGVVLIGILGIDQAPFVATSVGMASVMMVALISLSILAGCGAPRSR